MNGRKSKLIRKKVKPLFLNWLSTLLPEEEIKKLSEKNINDYLPKETHLYIADAVRLHSYSPRWLAKKIKIFNKRNPNVEIKDITLEDLKTIYERKY